MKSFLHTGGKRATISISVRLVFGDVLCALLIAFLVSFVAPWLAESNSQINDKKTLIQFFLAIVVPYKKIAGAI